MIDGIGKSGAGRIELARSPAGQSASAAIASGAPGGSSRSGGLSGAVADLVALGPPVESERVAVLRQAIAEGRYHADPQAIADRMIAADLGR
ncbi:MAG TPA: flagellar biosynthesis anti-sigma factor FlgM [Allosphingosinicella sp.]|jgi:negative regulator of flagellin synthesis FlgM